MSVVVSIQSNHKAIRRYRHTLDTLRMRGVAHEGGLRHAFATLLRETGGECNWTLDEEVSIAALGQDNTIRLDGLMRNEHLIPRGYWEAKGPNSNLEAEIEIKRRQGYPLSNIIFENTVEVVLIQDGQIKRAETRKPVQLGKLLTQFYNHENEPLPDLDTAIAQFRFEVPQFADALLNKIQGARVANPSFQQSFAVFMDLCRAALNPDITCGAIDEMLVQHILTGRIIHDSFDRGFLRHNVIAAEVENVIDSLTSPYFDLDDFLGPLNRIYVFIENTTKRLTDFSEKQTLLNRFYEGFFQAWSVKNADKLGIVYTPQEVVDFMCVAVSEALQTEFGLCLGDEGVEVIDPCTGTGNFVVNLLRQIAEDNRELLTDFYKHRLFANEVMLMAYYIASLNIEQEYNKWREGDFSRFEGLSFVDTLGMADGSNFNELSKINSERVARQKLAPINVIIGNPPYNVGQRNENENNQNRRYPTVDKRVRDTYVKDSNAGSKTKVNDAYVKFFRWATDRLGDRDGLICFVSNNNFVDGIALDGMRKHLLQDFTRIWHLDLAGNIRKGKGEGENVFGNRSGVSIGITLALRKENHNESRLFYHRVVDNLSTEAKLEELAKWTNVDGCPLKSVPWRELKPDIRLHWLPAKHSDVFHDFLPIGEKVAKGHPRHQAKAIFHRYSLGVSTNKDDYLYAFDDFSLKNCVKAMIEVYDYALYRVTRRNATLEEVIDTTDIRIQWTRKIKRNLRRHLESEYWSGHIRKSLYRPFTFKFLYYDPFWVEEPRLFREIFPTLDSERENKAIVIPGKGNRTGFGCDIVNQMVRMDQAFEKVQCFPFWTYDEDGTNRRDNITDWALEQFRVRYGDDSISRCDIFYYVYGLLHHLDYRARHVDSLRREMPRIPLVPKICGFRAICDAGRELARLHLDFEEIAPYELERVWTGERNWLVKRMSPVKEVDATHGDFKIFDSLRYNDSLTLCGIPAEAFDYRFGRNSALEWVIDQYRVKDEARTGIVSDPNAWSEDEQYIANLVGRVIRVSVDTVAIVNELARQPLTG